MASLELINARKRATHLTFLLAEIKQQIEVLTKTNVNKLCSEEEKKILIENENLKNEVKQLRNHLIQLEMKNNKKQKLLPSISSLNKAQLSIEKLNSSVENPSMPKVKLEIVKSNNDKKGKEKIEQNKEIRMEKKNVSVNKETKSEAASDDVVTASRLNMRIGKIMDVTKHPDADSLYVETVDVGEAKHRTIVSGLVNHVTLEQMKDRVAVFLLNLKPAKMRGIMSEGMIMCASTPEKVEVIEVPDGVVIGERVTIEGYEGNPDEQLNPKKKIWEQIQPDLKIDAHGLATYKGHLWKDENGNSFKASTLKNCPIK